MVYDTGFTKLKVYAARSLKKEDLNPMAIFDPKLLRVKIWQYGEMVWINIKRNQLIRRSAAGIPFEVFEKVPGVLTDTRGRVLDGHMRAKILSEKIAGRDPV